MNANKAQGATLLAAWEIRKSFTQFEHVLINFTNHVCCITSIITHSYFQLSFPPLPPHGHIWDVMLVWRKGNIDENCLCAAVLYTIIMVHKGTSSSYRSVDYRALILLSLALFRAPLCLRSSWCYICIKFFCLHPSLYLLVSWLTIILQCYDTVGWVMWPVKSSPRWPIMCRVGR